MKAKTRNSYDLVHRHGQLWLISCRSCRVVTVTQCCATVELTNRQTPQRFYEFSHWFGLKAKHVFGMPLTLCFLHKNDLGIGAEVLPSQDHLLATQNRAAVHVLLLDHGKLVSWTLSCRDTQKGGMQHLLPFYWCHFLQCVDFLFFFVFVNFFAFYAVTWTLCSRYWQFSPALTYHRLHNQFLVIAQYCRKEKKKKHVTDDLKVHYWFLTNAKQLITKKWQCLALNIWCWVIQQSHPVLSVLISRSLKSVKSQPARAKGSCCCLSPFTIKYRTDTKNKIKLTPKRMMQPLKTVNVLCSQIIQSDKYFQLIEIWEPNWTFRWGRYKNAYNTQTCGKKYTCLTGNGHVM